MKSVTVKILRDPEDRNFWLARFRLGGRSFCTQGAIVDEARYMAAELLKLMGAAEGTKVTFSYDDRESLSSLLARPVTPSLMTEEEAEAEDRIGSAEAQDDITAAEPVLAAATSDGIAGCSRSRRCR